MAKAKVIQTGAACIILVEGDPTKRQEPGENIIKFPGGSISVVRTTDNEYWAHIEVHQDQILEETHRESKHGEIVDSRVEFTDPHRILPIADHEQIRHIGVRICISGPE